MYKDDGIENMKIYIKDRRDNDLSYNKEQRDKMVNKTDIIFNNIGKEHAESLQRMTLLGDKVVFLEEKTEKGLESHDRDIEELKDFFEDTMSQYKDKLMEMLIKIKDFEGVFDIDVFIRKINRLTEKERLHNDLISELKLSQTRDMDILEARLIKLEEATIKHSDILADYLEDRFKKLQAQVDKIAWGLQVLEEKH